MIAVLCLLWLLSWKIKSEVSNTQLLVRTVRGQLIVRCSQICSGEMFRKRELASAT